MLNKLIFLFFLFSFCLFPVFADKFSFSADKLESVRARGKERTVLNGNAKVISDNSTIYADQMEIYGTDNRFIICNGSVRVEDKKEGINLISEKLFYDRIKKVARVNGQALMEDKKNEVIVKGGFLENHEEDNITIIQIGVRILKENLACRSEFALYKREDKLLELSGMPVVYKEGDEYRASKIIINIETEDITLEGDVEGSISSEKDKEESK